VKLEFEGEWPFDLSAERAVVGSVMFEPKALGEVLPIVEAADFYDPANRAVFEAMVELDRRSAPLDSISIGDELRAAGRLGQLESVGGLDYLSQLMLEVVTTNEAARRLYSISWICVLWPRAPGSPNRESLHG